MVPEPARFSKVLVVEDHQPDLALLCEILEDEGFAVCGVGSAAEALDSVANEEFGVAIVDLRLPDLHGNQLTEKLLDVDDKIHVIIYTGAASYDSVKEALNCGAFAYVEKLSDPAELLRHVNRACRERVDRYALDLEQAVQERTEALAQSNHDLENFASVVAHDLRSPLLTISGYCQILQEEYAPQLDETAIGYLAHVVGGVRRMNRLIEDLLSYSRLGRSEMVRKPVDVAAVLGQVQDNLQLSIAEAGATLDIGPMPVLPADETQLCQLFQNLIDNAIKFRSEAEPRLRIEAHRDGDFWQFSVADNGVGIDQGFQEEVFQIFHRLNPQPGDSGTGIGLAVCKRIVRQHEGRIWFESTPGKGTTFFFTLAVEPAPWSDPLAEPQHAGQRGTA
jgi:signal transduction histidine kinase